MKKEKAIKEIEKFIRKRDFCWESIYVTDTNPLETPSFWIFKNLWEPREALRGNRLEIMLDKPRIIIDKANGMINELTYEEFETFISKFDNS